MRILLAISLLSVSLWSVSAANNLYNVKNNRDFDQTIQKNDMVLVKFSGPKCATCKTMEPKVQSAANMLKKDKVLVAEVDCNANKSVCDKYKIRSYPTLQVFRKGRPSNLMMKGKRLMVRDVASSLTELHSQEELENLKKNEPLVAVAYLDPKEQDTLTVWNQLSEKLGNEFAFGLVTDKALMKAEHVTSAPSVVLYKKFDNLRDVYEEETAMSVEKLEDFIKVNAVPLLAPIEPSTFIDYVEANRPLVYIFSESPEQQEQMQALFLPLAEKYKGYFTFAHINPTEYAEQVGFMHLEDKHTWPAVAVHNFKNDARIPYDQTKAIDEQGITEFLEEIKQQTTNEEEEEPSSSLDMKAAVVEVTQQNFEDIVMDTSKDVLLEVYAPWCGHCRRLAPTYQQLGEFMQVNNAQKHGIVVAKMDGTKNSVPESAGFTVRAYPTIKLIKAGTNEVVDYHGERTLHDFVDFLGNESTKQTLKIDLSSLPQLGEKITLKHANKNVQVEDNKPVEA